jgi:hypothetical protein
MKKRGTISILHDDLIYLIESYLNLGDLIRWKKAIGEKLKPTRKQIRRYVGQCIEKDDTEALLSILREEKGYEQYVNLKKLKDCLDHGAYLCFPVLVEHFSKAWDRKEHALWGFENFTEWKESIVEEKGRKLLRFLYDNDKLDLSNGGIYHPYTFQNITTVQLDEILARDKDIFGKKFMKDIRKYRDDEFKERLVRQRRAFIDQLVYGFEDYSPAPTITFTRITNRRRR